MIYGALLAIVVFVVANYIFNKQKRKLIAQKQKPVDGLATSKLTFDYATVADDLFPVTSKLDLDGAHISVMSGDGSYILLPKHEKLKAGLKDWCARGASIDYILTSAKPQVKQAFATLKAEIGAQFNLIDASGCHGKYDFTHLHPTLFHLKNNENAMWLESEHPSNSMVAYGVTYLPPGSMHPSSHDAFLFNEFSNSIKEIHQKVA